MAGRALSPGIGGVGGVVTRAVRLARSAAFSPPHPPIREHIESLGWAADSSAAYCPVCGQSVGEHQLPAFAADAAEPPRCQRCVGQRRAVDRTVRLGVYGEPLAGWVHDIKFHNIRLTARVLGGALSASLGPVLWDTGPVVVVPIPTPYRRRVSRGIDHTGVLAASVAGALRVRLVRGLVASHHPPQRTRSLAERRRNTSGVYRARRVGVFAGCQVVLIDDVTTSGSTLRAASLSIRNGLRAEGLEGPTRVIAAVLAVTPAPGRRERERS